ncbi:nicotinamide adenine dinucleotide transporter 2, mitochondrial-like isoform X9 [Camellia sinensis]|uniref:nicotinamide adenine dinucleotide transporter 2, mitochondrial-like isoform X9 n=1 Tax=Camellia sinensis TaxID=4442 RepID=UPI0010356150|nr:nicotinamide adenine dinucleotide transporter 2, mitochondrial-like isoform X9 [Camellia sinensis]
MTAGGARLPDRRTSKKIICDAAADAAAAATAATFVCPLDVIKTRLQVHGLPEAHHSGPKGMCYKSMEGSIIITSLQNIIRTEGLKGLYRGLSPTLVALLPNWAVLVLSQQLQQIHCGLLRPDSKEVGSCYLQFLSNLLK